METSLSPILTGSSEHTLHLSYKNHNQQKKEFNLDLSTELVLRNNLKNRETDIIVLNGMEMFRFKRGYYQFGDQYLVPASAF